MWSEAPLIVPVYSIHVAQEPHTFRQRFGWSFFSAALWLLGFSSLERLAYGRWSNPIALAIGGAVFFLGGLFTSSVWPRELQSLDFKIDDFGVRVFCNGDLVRKVRSDRVRCVRERQGFWGRVLVISEERFLVRRFLRHNSVALPRRLLKAEEYEQIKALAQGWLNNSGAVVQ
jgi:hypothetical protein